MLGRRGNGRSRTALTLLCVLLGFVGSVAVACAPTKRLLMYGDSITFEAQGQLRARGIEVKAYGGTAVCDWFGDMRREAALRTVRTVYLEFVGNYFTSCVRSRPQLTAYLDDALTAVRLWRAAGVRVVWVRPPQPLSATPTPTPRPRPSSRR